MKIDSVRTFAMAMEAVTEAPHHHYSSFRVRGKIFVTLPPGDEFIHVFVGDEDREPACRQKTLGFARNNCRCAAQMHTGIEQNQFAGYRARAVH